MTCFEIFKTSQQLNKIDIIDGNKILDELKLKFSLPL